MKKIFLYYEGRAMDEFTEYYCVDDKNFLFNSISSYRFTLQLKQYEFRSYKNHKEYFLLQHDMKRKI